MANRKAAIGVAGPPAIGPYHPLHMNRPNGIAVDSQNRLWVAEADNAPRRVSLWSADGRLLRAFYGPTEYGGGGTLDPQDPSRFYYRGLEFKLDWDKGTDQLVRVFFRPGRKAAGNARGLLARHTPVSAAAARSPVFHQLLHAQSDEWRRGGVRVAAERWPGAAGRGLGRRLHLARAAAKRRFCLIGRKGRSPRSNTPSPRRRPVSVGPTPTATSCRSRAR